MEHLKFENNIPRDLKHFDGNFQYKVSFIIFE